MIESFSSRVSVHELLAALSRFERVDTPGPMFVNVTVDDRGTLEIAPDPQPAIVLQTAPLTTMT